MEYEKYLISREVISPQWYSLGSQPNIFYYQLWDLYKNKSGIVQDDYLLIISSYTGLIAQIHNYFKLLEVGKESSYDSTIYITNLVGYNVYLLLNLKICRFSFSKWSNQTIIASGWTKDEKFIVILQNGTLLKYKLFSGVPKVNTIFPELTNDIIILAHVGKSGCCLVTSKLKM